MQQSQCMEERAGDPVIGGENLLQMQLNPTAYAYYHYKWAIQEIADWCTRILFWKDTSDEEQRRCFDELKDYLPVRREELLTCLNGEAPKEALLRLFAQATSTES